MRRIAWTVFVVLVASAAWIVWDVPRGELYGQQPNTAAVKPLVLSDGLMALSSDTADGKQQVVVVDSKTRTMSVYHVEHTGGVITLKSVRNISADLLMDEFNTSSPVPSEIRAMLKERDSREKR
jgi:hypothetical protein